MTRQTAFERFIQCSEYRRAAKREAQLGPRLAKLAKEIEALEFTELPAPFLSTCDELTGDEVLQLAEYFETAGQDTLDEAEIFKAELKRQQN
jgi:hypothetical protein